MARLRLLFAAVLVGSIGHASAWAQIAPSPGAPDRGGVNGRVLTAIPPAALSRGSFLLPLPVDVPDEEGGPLFNIFPIYSPEAGLSEWGMGWQSALELRNDPQVPERLLSPWGPMVSGDGGDWYPSGLTQLVRLRLPTATGEQPIAYLPDGTTVRFEVAPAGSTSNTFKVARVSTVTDMIGRQTTITYLTDTSFVDTVRYGGTSASAYAPYLIKLNYEDLPLTSIVKVNRRVSAVQLARCKDDSCTIGAAEVRWRYDLTYTSDELSPSIFYLNTIQKAFARSGERLPPQTFGYNTHSGALASAAPVWSNLTVKLRELGLAARDLMPSSLMPGPAEPGRVQGSGQGAFYFDRHQDGLIDFGAALAGNVRFVGNPPSIHSLTNDGDASNPSYAMFVHDTTGTRDLRLHSWWQGPPPASCGQQLWVNECRCGGTFDSYRLCLEPCHHQPPPPKCIPGEDGKVCEEEYPGYWPDECPFCSENLEVGFCDSAHPLNCEIKKWLICNSAMGAEFPAAIRALAEDNMETMILSSSALPVFSHRFGEQTVQVMDACTEAISTLVFRGVSDSGVSADATVIRVDHELMTDPNLNRYERVDAKDPVFLADIDGDGRQDLMREVERIDNNGNRQRVIIANLGTGQGRFANTLEPVLLASGEFTVIDIDGDGRDDLLRHPRGSADYRVEIRKPDVSLDGMDVWQGQSFFDSYGASLEPYAGRASVSGSDELIPLDVNRDGLMDLVVLGRSQQLQVFTDGRHVGVNVPPTTPPRIFISQGVQSSSGTWRFAEVDIPGIRSIWQPSAWTLPVDLIGDGEAHLLFLFDPPALGDTTVVYDLPLTDAGTGLMRAYNDGLGNQYSFAYARTPPAPEVDQRFTVLETMTVESAGEPSLKQSFSYVGPHQHSVGKYLLGFDVVFVNTSADDGSTLSTQAMAFINDDSTSGLLRYSLRMDGFGNIAAGFECEFGATDGSPPEPVTTFGVKRYRPRSCRSGLATVSGAEPFTSTAFRNVDTFEYDERGLCQKIVKHTTHGGATLTTETEYDPLDPSSVIPGHLTGASGLMNAIVCLPVSVSVTDGYDGVTQATSICRNGIGQVTATYDDALGCGDTQASRLRLSRATYDDTASDDGSSKGDHILRSMERAGVGTTTYTYLQDHRPLLERTTAPDGTWVETTDVDSLTAHPASIKYSSGYRQCFLYDGQERLRQSWDKTEDCTTPLPLVTYRYQRPAGGSQGQGALAVTECTDVFDLQHGYARRTAEVASAAGTAIGSARQAFGGWAFSPITKRSILDGVARSEVFALGEPLSDPFTASVDGLAASGQLIAARATSGTGLFSIQSEFLHQDVRRTLVTTASLQTDGIRYEVKENGGFSTLSTLSDDGKIIAYQDEQGVMTKDQGSYTYDAHGRLRKVVLPDGDIALVDYNAHGQLSALSRTSAQIGQARGVSFAYDATSGLLRSKTISVGGVLDHFEAFDYDDKGRITTRALLDATGNAQQGYVFYYDGTMLDESVKPTDLLEEAQKGHLTGIAGDGFSKSFFYRQDGQLQRAALNILGQRSVIVDYDYFDNGAPMRETTFIYMPQAANVAACLKQEITKEIVIDGFGRPVQVLVNGQLFVDVAYDELGRAKDMAYPDGSIVRFIYDPYTLARIGYERFLADGTTTLSSKVSFSNRGLIDTETMDSEKLPTSRGYEYTAQRFLMNAREGDKTYSYAPDPKSGLLQTSAALASQGYAFDGKGRLIKRASTSYGYGFDDQIHDVCASTDPSCCNESGNFCGNRLAHYIYDEAGQRLAKIDDDGELVGAYTLGGVLDGSGVTSRVSIAGVHAGTLRGSMFSPFATDLRGTVLGGSDVKPSPYGARPAQPASSEVSSFIRKPFDPDLRLVRLGVRDYDPEIGQFVQPDPLYLERPDLCVGDHVGCNLYSYANNDPVNYVDRNGKFPWLIAIGVGLAILGQLLGSYLSSGGGSVYAGAGIPMDISPGGGLFAPPMTSAQVMASPVSYQAHQVTSGLNVVATQTINAAMWTYIGAIGAAVPPVGLGTLGTIAVQAKDEHDPALMAAAGLRIPAGAPAASVRSIMFGQRGISSTFRNGPFAGQTIEEVSAGLRSGAINPNQLPIQTITREGIEYTLNNRSLMALREAGLEPTVIFDVTGDPFFEAQLTDRLLEIGTEVDAEFVPIIRGRK